MRATSSAIMNLACRLGGIIMPWVINESFILGTFGPFVAIAGISAVSTIATYLLPLDTTGLRLD
jgi:hypothetical protein